MERRPTRKLPRRAQANTRRNRSDAYGADANNRILFFEARRRSLRADRPEKLCRVDMAAPQPRLRSTAISQINLQNLEHFIQHAEIPESQMDL